MLSILVLLLLAGIVAGFSQRFMLYKPGFYSVADVRRLAGEQRLRLWPADGSDYMGLVSGAARTPGQGTVVVFHGNAGVAPYRSHYVDALEKLGHRVVLAEYPGYGGRGGWLTEKSLVADGVRVARRAKEEFGAPLYLWGESMGAGVAAGVARELGLEADGVVMLTPWDSLENMARMLFPSFLVRLLLRDPYDNVRNLSGFTGPVAVVVAEHDEVIPNVRGLRLHEVLAGHKRLWMLTGCGHNNWPDRIESEFWGEITAYLASPAKRGL